MPSRPKPKNTRKNTSESAKFSSPKSTMPLTMSPIRNDNYYQVIFGLLNCYQLFFYFYIIL